MAFFIGTANNANELLTALTNSCTNNGWVLNSGILSKNDCFVRVYVNDITLAIAGGTGQNGNSLTGTVLPANQCPVSFAGVNTNITYPLTYYLHILENEVYMIVNFNVDMWSYIAFGQSPISDIGTGNWYSGTGTGAGSFNSRYISNRSDYGCIQLMMFPQSRHDGWTGSTYVQTVTSFIHHNLDGMEWSCNGDTVGSYPNNNITNVNSPSKAMATIICKPLLNRQPNSWNNEAILLPITPAIYRADNRRSIVGSIKHAFYTRIDNYEPAQIITIGSERYRIYPWIQKDSVNRDASGNINNYKHSGTYGFAVRYDGD